VIYTARGPVSVNAIVLFFKKFLRIALFLGLFGLVIGAATLGGVYWWVKDDIPSVDKVREVQLQVPLKVFSSDGLMIASFGETRRNPVKLAQMPLQLRQAFIAVEDAKFYSHYGIDPQGIARAVWELVSTGEKGSGGSTITQQLSRGLFLSNERTYRRKIIEIFTALRLERALSKDEILELYLNKIFLGQRAYGVAAAAEVYYGKALGELSLSESAMLAALPKAPSELNPIFDPRAAKIRRDLVLGRMLAVGFIDQTQHDRAVAAPDMASLHSPPVELEAPYIAEMVRIEAEKILGAEKALTGGFRLITTVDSVAQRAANAALIKAVQSYDRRHGWRGAEAKLDPELLKDPAALDRALEPYWSVAGMTAGAVMRVSADEAVVHLSDGQDVTISLDGARWARRYLSEAALGPAPKRLNDLLAPADVIRVIRDADGNFTLAQVPRVQAGFVALDPEDGAIRALIGGYSFGLSKFNRVTQSTRPAGSSFKPFVYSASFEKGFTTASIVNDAPIVFEDASIDKVWKPQNDNEKFNGPTRLREAMVSSRNLVSVRVLDAIGVRFARRYILRFGFTAESLPENLSLALGTSAAPPIAMARGYAAFANTGFLVTPHLIASIEDNTGKVVYQAQAPRACRRCPERLELELAYQEAQAIREAEEAENDAANPSAPIPKPDTEAVTTASGLVLAPRAIDERNAYIITTMMRDVIKRGTARAAAALGRNDLAGKTGSTNDHRDAWFIGFSPHIVGAAWVGFDDFSSLGEGEFGGKAALPMWMDFMQVVLQDKADELLEQPTGITTARINGSNGLLTSAGDPGGIMEVFRTEDLSKLGSAIGSTDRSSESDPLEVF
jgi:penicillin-binding protein 1A